jgi:hypothetical protein
MGEVLHTRRSPLDGACLLVTPLHSVVHVRSRGMKGSGRGQSISGVLCGWSWWCNPMEWRGHLQIQWLGRVLEGAGEIQYPGQLTFQTSTHPSAHAISVHRLRGGGWDGRVGDGDQVVFTFTSYATVISAPCLPSSDRQPASPLSHRPFYPPI